jgi:hypothetical protein
MSAGTALSQKPDRQALISIFIRMSDKYSVIALRFTFSVRQKDPHFGK